jgi:dTDP-4-dehydrorhamnose reductase
VSSGTGEVGKILVLGGGGLLGHKMFQILGNRFADTWCTLRSRRNEAPWHSVSLYQSPRVIDAVDASDFVALATLLREVRPAVIVNAIGAIKQRAEAQDAITSIAINSLLPHRLAVVAREWNARLIHFSTDCVFSGAKGCYTEADHPDATDLYGKTKHLGEVSTENVLTFRTSFIGRELQQHLSLLDWFLAQTHHKVKGYRRVWWSGLTSNHLADVVADVIQRHPSISGLYHLCGGRISKYELLVKVRDGLKLDIEVEPDDTIECDRSLDGTRFAHATGYRCPSWDTLIDQLAEDPTPYEAWTDQHGVSR